MRIVHVNDIVFGYAMGDHSARGGAERYAWHLLRELANAGWSVTVGVRFKMQPGEEKVIAGVRFLGMSRESHFLLDWFKLLKQVKPDWCLWQCADYMWGPAAQIARWLGVRTAFSTMHDRDVQPRKALNLRKSWWPLYVWGLRRSNLILVQHQGQRDQLPALLQGRAYSLPGIVSLPSTVIPHSERSGSVAWVAVIRPVKRLDRLIEIARRLPMVRFMVCGAPATGLWDRKALELILEQLQSLPNVDYRGHVDPEESLRIIGNANLLLSTSDGEGFPSVFLEAWAAGTPVVSVEIDPDHKIQNHGLGIVANTIEGTGEAVRSLMASPQRCQDLGVKARHHVEQFYSASVAVHAFEKAAASVSDGRGMVMHSTNQDGAV